MREHMESENVHDFDATIGTFGHPRYEIVPTGDVYDGEEEVRRTATKTSTSATAAASTPPAPRDRCRAAGSGALPSSMASRTEDARAGDDGARAQHVVIPPSPSPAEMIPHVEAAVGGSLHPFHVEPAGKHSRDANGRATRGSPRRR